MFEIKQTSNNGEFHFKSNKALSLNEMTDVVKIIDNLLSDKTIPILNDEYRLGQNPVSSIDMGNYDPPDTGYYIKIFHSIKADMHAIKLFREATGISIKGCRDIVRDNFPCPTLTKEIAEFILSGLKKLGIHAKIFPSQSS